MPLRETRRFKTKGFAISFGDIMLPLVGVIAIGLVVVAGKLFFSGTQMDHPSVPVIIEPTKIQEKPAQAAQPAVASPPPVPVSPPPVSTPVPVSTPTSERRSPSGLDVLAVPYDGAKPEAPKSGVTAVVTPSPPPAATRQPQQPKPQPALNSTRAPVQTKPADSKPKSESRWMVQVGAFSTQAAAQAFSEQVAKAGYSPTVVSSPTLFKVFVQSGTTKDEALKLATQMNRSGFQGAFIVPPRP